MVGGWRKASCWLGFKIFSKTPTDRISAHPQKIQVKLPNPGKLTSVSKSSFQVDTTPPASPSKPHPPPRSKMSIILNSVSFKSVQSRSANHRESGKHPRDYWSAQFLANEDNLSAAAGNRRRETGGGVNWDFMVVRWDGMWIQGGSMKRSRLMLFCAWDAAACFKLLAGGNGLIHVCAGGSGKRVAN